MTNKEKDQLRRDVNKAVVEKYGALSEQASFIRKLYMRSNIFSELVITLEWALLRIKIMSNTFDLKEHFTSAYDSARDVHLRASKLDDSNESIRTELNKLKR